MKSITEKFLVTLDTPEICCKRTPCVKVPSHLYVQPFLSEGQTTHGNSVNSSFYSLASFVRQR